LPLVMVFMAVLCLLAMGTTLAFRVEPKGRSLEDIAAAEHAVGFAIAVQS